MPRNILYYIIAPCCLGLEAGYKEEESKERWKGRRRSEGKKGKYLCLGPAHHHAQLRIVNEGGWSLRSIEYCEHNLTATYLLQ
jgi:hypothetical protein